MVYEVCERRSGAVGDGSDINEFWRDRKLTQSWTFSYSCPSLISLPLTHTPFFIKKHFLACLFSWVPARERKNNTGGKKESTKKDLEARELGSNEVIIFLFPCFNETSV